MNMKEQILQKAKQNVRVVKINKHTTWYIADLAPLNKQIWTEYEEAVQENLNNLMMTNNRIIVNTNTQHTEQLMFDF